MTEKRPPYDAFSLTDAHQSASPLEQHDVDGTISHRDMILLLPVLQSLPSIDQRFRLHDRCMHIVHMPDGDLGFCNSPTEEHCKSCEAPVRDAHSTHGTLTLLTAARTSHDLPDVTLCETCTRIGSNRRAALHAFLYMLNTEGQVS